MRGHGTVSSASVAMRVNGVCEWRREWFVAAEQIVAGAGERGSAL